LINDTKWLLKKSLRKLPCQIGDYRMASGYPIECP
jgi:hypothetical protein